MGELFGTRYELVDLLGQGGTGSVWRIWDHRRRIYRAAKVLRQSDAASLLRFVREQSRRIDHLHVLAPDGWIGEDDRVLLTMDLVTGGSVATLLGDHGPLPPSYAAVLLYQLFDALDAVHGAGLVHRDVKPANLLLECTGSRPPVLRLSDFGIAVRRDEPRLTAVSSVIGTPGYLPPETLAVVDPSPAQDIYAVGVTGVEMLTGSRPPPGPLGAAPAGVPPRLWQMLGWCVDSDPTRRLPTAADGRKLLAASGALPAPGARPAWLADDEPVEVLDQLPALPAGWGPQGPIAAWATATPAKPSKAATNLRRRAAWRGRRARIAAGTAAVGLAAGAFFGVANLVGSTSGHNPGPSAIPATPSGSRPRESPVTTQAPGQQSPATVHSPGASCSFVDVGIREQGSTGGVVECRKVDDRYQWVPVR